MMRRFDQLFGDIVAILRRDYAGWEALEGFDPPYYNQAIGQAWHDDRLDELLFLRYVSQMLACTGDRALRLELLPREGYEPYGPGFFTRRFGDSLYVTALAGETRLAIGDRIRAINGGSPAHHREVIQKNFFYAGPDAPEREDWNGLLKMADTVTVNGEVVPLARYPRKSPHPGPAALLEKDVLYLRPPVLDAPEAAESLIPALEAGPLRALILDMRQGDGSAEEAFYPLLPWLCRRDTPLSGLLGPSELFVNYTPLNCALRAAALEAVPGGEPYIAELREKAGRGFLPEDSAPEETVVPGRGPEQVVVLTDTWCRGAGESLVLAAKSAGAALIGRPTLGTLDHSGPVSCRLDERFIFTWPTAVTGEARAGRGMMGVGIQPDIYVPWTPEECGRDVLLAAALEYIHNA
ncbi:MAG: S41 family peptidase [Oscillospiraceae bacterium]|nr:S41 family peptidase [Oscillospiraceae bacterium]